MTLNINKVEFLNLIDEGIEKNKTIVELKADVAELKADVAVLKADVAWLKRGFQRHEIELKNLNERMHKQGILMEELRDHLKIIAEAVSPLLKKSESIDDLNQKLENNVDHIVVVESALKSHINDKSLHIKK